MIYRYGDWWVTADEGAQLLGPDINPAMIRKWAHRGLLKRHTYRSRTIYLLSQLQAVEQRTRTSPAGRKRGANLTRSEPGGKLPIGTPMPAVNPARKPAQPPEATTNT